MNCKSLIILIMLFTCLFGQYFITFVMIYSTCVRLFIQQAAKRKKLLATDFMAVTFDFGMGFQIVYWCVLETVSLYIKSCSGYFDEIKYEIERTITPIDNRSMSLSWLDWADFLVGRLLIVINVPASIQIIDQSIYF